MRVSEGQLRSSTLEKKRDKAEIVWDSGFTGQGMWNM